MRAPIVFAINLFAGIFNLVMFYYTNKPLNMLFGVLCLYLANKVTKDFHKDKEDTNV